MDAIETLPIERWDGPFEADAARRAIAALEGGRVLVLPRLAFPLTAEERSLLSATASDGTRKNVSYDPRTGECRGAAVTGEDAARLAAVMRRYADAATSLLHGLAPGYVPGLERARTSFRPTEIAGRPMPWRKDDTRLHVDAFPSRPTRGRRILRVFNNVDPDGTPRRWQVGEGFEAHARRYLPRLRAPLPGAAAMLAAVGLTKGRRSAYDHLMLQLHDAAKQDAAYQAAPRPDLEFPPGTTWLVYTDQVPHAALAGRNAFEQTFHLDVAAMADPATSPVRVLERLAGRALV